MITVSQYMRKFQDFQGPTQFSSDLKALNLGKKSSIFIGNNELSALSAYNGCK